MNITIKIYKTEPYSYVIFSLKQKKKNKITVSWGKSGLEPWLVMQYKDE